MLLWGTDMCCCCWWWWWCCCCCCCCCDEYDARGSAWPARRRPLSSAATICALAASFSTSVAWRFFSVFLTNDAISTLQRRSTSSRRYRPVAGAPSPISTISGRSPGRLPLTVHLSRMSTPMGARQCVCSPLGRLLNTHGYFTSLLAKPPFDYLSVFFPPTKFIRHFLWFLGKFKKKKKTYQ